LRFFLSCSVSFDGRILGFGFCFFSSAISSRSA
jgi:hypothetical protein